MIALTSEVIYMQFLTKRSIGGEFPSLLAPKDVVSDRLLLFAFSAPGRHDIVEASKLTG